MKYFVYKIIWNLIPSSSIGKVFINNIDITSMDEDELAIFRRRNIGFIFQYYNLIGNLTVLENITLPIELDGNEIPYDFIIRSAN